MAGLAITMCTKRAYPDKKTAMTAKNWHERAGTLRDGARGLRVYYCPLGPHWHLTKIRRRERV